MPAKLTLYPSQGASRHFVLREGESGIAGRDPASDLSLSDRRASARHALFNWNGDCWALFDLESKNGTFVNGVAARGVALEHEDWISFGGLLARFELVRVEDVAALEEEREARLRASVEITQELLRQSLPEKVLRRLLESALEVAGAERGFVLVLSPDGRLQAEVASGFLPNQPLDERFAGSLGALKKALRTGQSVVAADARTDSFLGKRPSVLEMGIGALACVPLSLDNHVIGALYVDGRRQGGRFTELDLELLEALAGHAALVVTGMRLDRQIRELLGKGTPPEPGEGRFLEELGRRVEEIAQGSAPRKALRLTPHI